MTKIKYPNYIIYDIFIKKLKALNVIVHVVYSCQENSIFIYLFNQEGPIEIQYLFYQGDLVKIGSKGQIYKIPITTQ